MLNEKGENSFIYYPKTNLIEIKGDEISFYNQGFKKATEEEQKTYDIIKSKVENKTYNEEDRKKLFELTDKYSKFNDCLGNWTDDLKGDLLMTIELMEA